MPIEKGQNRDESVFMKWKITKGARIYKSDESDIFVQLEEKYTKITLEEPEYDEIVSADVLEKFEVDESEKLNDDYVETEIKIAGS